jgi:DNA repair protein RadC
MQRVKDLPLADRPRERLKRLGAEALNSDELLAVVLGTGSKKDSVLQLSRALISRFGSIHGLSDATLEELQTVPGIGYAKALKLKAAFSLSKRCHSITIQEILTIDSPKEAFLVSQPYIKNEKREVFLAVLLNIKNCLIAVEIVSIGILNATLVHPREFFFPAIRRKAHAVIAVHNHPSGNLQASEADISITRQLIKAAEIIAIPILDHLIISQDRYYSFKEDGFTFNHDFKGSYAAARLAEREK